MTDENDIGVRHNSTTRRVWTPCGNMYVTIAYRNDEADKVDFIRINMANRNNMCGASWTEAMSETLSLLLSRMRIKYKGDIEALFGALKSHRCNKYMPNQYKIMSCVDALRRVCEKEFGDILNEDN